MIVVEDKDLISIQQARCLIEKAERAEQLFKTFSQEQVDHIVEVMAKAAEQQAGRLASMALEETGYGKAEDKTIKNLFSSGDVYRYIKDLKTCGVVAENKDKRVVDIAVPVGVIVAITPSTNPTSTAIFKLLCAIKGRNTVVLSPHPHAARCTGETARVMYEAALSAGAPVDCIKWMDVVTMEGTQELMRHRKTGLILATGGAALVRAAYSSGKPAFGVGPGNVPAFIERTAGVPKAVGDVLTGKTFDWGVLCSSEQSLICDKPIEEQVLEELEQKGAHLLNREELEKLNKLIQLPSKTLNPAIVGKAPQLIAKMAGFSVPAHVVCLVGRPDGVGRNHPLSMEKLSPILAFYTVDGWKEGCERSIEILSFGGLGHTMVIHSQNKQVIMEFGLHKPAYRICVNTPATHGSIGLTTGVPPSMTLGCGTPGGNITSDNITPLHLINIKRLAYELRPASAIRYPSVQPSRIKPTRTIRNDKRSALETTEVRSVVRDLVDDYFKRKRELNIASKKSSSPAAEASGTPKDLPTGPPVEFVSEDDVRQALASKKKIVVNAKTILTPSARDLAEGKSVLVWEEIS